MNRESFSQPSMTELWAGDSGRRWSAVADALEAQLEPVGAALLSSSAIASGERVVDVGCGRGATTRGAAALTGPTGRVLGLDVSPALIDDAQRLARDHMNIDWLVADAQRADLTSHEFDVVISRFGTLFFDDPIAAFANLARGTVPNGRLCVSVWQRRDASDVFQRPLDVGSRVLSGRGFRPEREDPTAGPYSFGDARLARDTLEAAGWTDVVHAPRDLDLYLGGPGSVEHAVDSVLAFGPLQRQVAEAPRDAVAAVRDALIADFDPRHDGTGVRLGAAIAIVTARRGTGKT